MISKKTAIQLISDLNETDETEHIEAKSIASGKAGKSVLETICAFSNEPGLGGGTILLGVEKEEALFSFYSPAGVADPDKISSEIASACSTTFNHPVRIEISAEKVGKATVLRLNVPELAAHQKPLFFESKGLPKGAFRRIGPTDHRCTEEDLLLFYQGKESSSYDVTLISDATWDDIDPRAVEAYRKARRDVNPLADELQWSDEELVYALGGIRKLDGNLRVTVAGLVTFGRTSALRRLSPSHRVDYVRVQGTQWSSDLTNAFDSIELRGPLMTLAGRVLTTILDDLPRAFHFDNSATGQRRDSPILPVRAILEALVNSLIHRSYSASQPVQIIRYSNRVEFRNPGYSLKSEDRFDEPASIMRNPQIAEVMHETRFAETKGSGIRRMRELMEESGLSSPTFDSDREGDLFSAIFLFHHFLNPDDWKWLSHFRAFELTDDQRRALIFVREVGAIDNQSYRGLTKTDTLEASKSLKSLTKMGLLSKQGVSVRTYYIPGTEMKTRAELPIVSGVDSTEIGHADSRSEIPSIVQRMPAHLRISVHNARLRKKLTVDIARDAIGKLCVWRAFSSSQIADILGKNVEYVQESYLRPLVKEGVIRYLHPEQPNHPKQKYLGGSKKGS